ncbi:MAG: hypothetical protein B7Y53_02565, partial [Halothiobacillus sp. 28-55-5]
MLKSIIEASIKNRVLVLLLAAILAVVGWYSWRATPLDAIPDILPVIGFSDDAAVMFLAFQALTSNITPAHQAAAKEIIARLRTRRQLQL